MADHQLAFTDAKGGMNAFDPPHKIGTNQVARMVNCAIVDGLPTTRPGGRVVPFSGSAAEFLSAAPIQGSVFYNPAAGQGGIILAESNASLAVVAGGRKILATIQGRRPNPKASLQDITGAFVSSAQNHLAWLCQWEDLLIVADGEGPTFIYSPLNGARLSLGYNSIDKLKSEIPSGATVLAYAHARGVAVVNSHNILVGDPLFRTNLTSSSNLTGFTEQVYWATGAYFLPPSMMGSINAAAILPLQNTQHGHGELMVHCAGGIFSLDLNQYPRENWANLQLTKHVNSQAGATGPYAIAIQVGDQLFRTRMGAQSLRSAAATPSDGSSDQTISPEVDTWFAGDYKRWLRFASVGMWSAMRRGLFTTAPIVQGTFRWHRGIVVRNTDVSLTVVSAAPAPGVPAMPAAWEGLWTFPPQFAGVIQMVNGMFDGEERQFFWARGTDSRNRLVELCPGLRDDVMEDGTHHPIRCQVWTRAIDAGKFWEKRQYTDTRLYLRNIAGDVKWGVWFRPDENPGWRFYRAGTVSAPDYSADLNSSAGVDTRSVSIALGTIPDNCTKGGGKLNESRSIQFMVRWEGFCTFEAIKVEHTSADLSSTQFDNSGLKVTFSQPGGCAYDDFEYSFTDTSTWFEK